MLFRKLEPHVLKREKKHKDTVIDFESLEFEKFEKPISNIFFFIPNNLVVHVDSGGRKYSWSRNWNYDGNDDNKPNGTVWNAQRGIKEWEFGNSKYSRIMKWNESSVLMIRRDGVIETFRVVKPYRKASENELHCLKNSQVSQLLKGSGRDILVALTKKGVEVVSYTQDTILKTLRIKIITSDCPLFCYCRRRNYGDKYVQFDLRSRAIMSKAYPNILYTYVGSLKKINLETGRTELDIVALNSSNISELDLLHTPDGVEHLLIFRYLPAYYRETRGMRGRVFFYNMITGSCRRVLHLDPFDRAIRYMGSGYLFCLSTKQENDPGLVLQYLGSEFRRVSPYCCLLNENYNNIILEHPFGNDYPEKEKDGIYNVAVIEEDVEKKVLRVAISYEKELRIATIGGLEDLSIEAFLNRGVRSSVYSEDLKERFQFLVCNMDMVFTETDSRAASVSFGFGNLVSEMKIHKVFLLL